MEKAINLVFDLDGCLIDSSEVQKLAFFGSYQEIVGDDKCPSYEEYMKHTGDSVDNVLKKMNLPASMAEVFRRISSKLIGKIIVNWDAIELIKEFRAFGCKIAICTGKDRFRTVDILNYYGIDTFFDILICADDVKKTKPSPVPILAAINGLHCTRNNVLVIGDGYNDILSAKNAGVKSILTLWYGDHGVPREADFVVKSVKELRNILYDNGIHP